MPEYSWSMPAARIRSSAYLTQGRMYGLPLLSLYAPIPRFYLFGFLSAWYATLSPIIGSAGAISMPVQDELPDDAKHLTVYLWKVLFLIKFRNI